MPSIVTHHLFAEDALNIIKKNTKREIDQNIYYIFSQSFDNLFYYKFLTPWKGKNIRELGNAAQKENVNLYFENIINEIVLSTEKKDLISYLYGSLCHYILDSTCHPYIFYYTGDALQNRKYRGLHEKMEVTIDALYLNKKKGLNLYEENLANKLLPKTLFSPTLKKNLDNVFIKTFQVNNMGNIYQKSILTGNFLLTHFVTDHIGFKKLLYTIKDSLTFWSTRKYKYLSFHVTKLEKDYLNENHQKWNHPTNKKEISTESFEDLYNKALQKYTYIVNSLENFWNNKISKEEILKIIGNDSYTTGKDCMERNQLKHFKF